MARSIACNDLASVLAKKTQVFTPVELNGNGSEHSLVFMVLALKNKLKNLLREVKFEVK